MPITIDIHAPNLDTRSELMKAKTKSINGRVNACPFGCGWNDLDDHGYCRHLVGFTTNGKTMEAMVRNAKTGLRTVKVFKEKIGETPMVDDLGVPVTDEKTGKQIMEPIYRRKPERVKPGDVLIRISTDSRVYRDMPGVKPVKRTEFVEAQSQEEADRAIREQAANMVKSPLQKSIESEPPVDFTVAGDEPFEE